MAATRLSADQRRKITRILEEHEALNPHQALHDIVAIVDPVIAGLHAELVYERDEVKYLATGGGPNA